MKLIDVYDDYKLKYRGYVILIKSGIFYNVFNDDTSILNSLFQYKVKNNSKCYEVGFPSSSISKICNTLKSKNISYIIVDKNNDRYVVTDKYKSKKNEYCAYQYDINKYHYLKHRIDNICCHLMEKINEDDIDNLLKQIEELI